MKVAIVGSGPAAYYVAEGLYGRFGRQIEIDLIERLPTPYGLVRSGVAPDHQATKQVWRRFANLHMTTNLEFFGNVEVGTTVGIDELRELYDAVVLATGASVDRRLGIPGEDLPGVYSATRFVSWYNSHPDYVDDPPLLEGTTAVIIGNGNVAIDVARVLLRSPDEMRTSDISVEAAARIAHSGLRDCRIVGRRGPLEVGFSLKELSELGSLDGVSTTVEPTQMPAPAQLTAAGPILNKVLGILAGFAAHVPQPDNKRLHLLFEARPVAVLGEDRVTGIRFERTVRTGANWSGTAEYVEYPCALVVSCIGYRARPIPGVPFNTADGVLANVNGEIECGLYCCGWAGRAPSGTIGSNRQPGFDLAARIVPRDGTGKTGRAGLRVLLASRRVETVDFAGWRAIDAAEVAAAQPGAPREKLLRRPDLLRAARSSAAAGDF